MMDESTGTPALNKALAAVQAKLPKIEKGQEGKVEGQTKEGKKYSYTYKYADLADLSAVVMPLLGQHGLAFLALPGLSATGQFGLAYSLRHESGEEKEGFYPISPGSPQQNGSAITYARRYCLGAVTGIAPAEDDDGAAAQHAPRAAGDAWDSATPARPAGSPAAQGNGGHISRPAEPPARLPQAAADDEVLGAWAAKLDEITSDEDAARVDAELKTAFKGGLIDASRANVIRKAIRDKAASVKAGAAA